MTMHMATRIVITLEMTPDIEMTIMLTVMMNNNDI